MKKLSRKIVTGALVASSVLSLTACTGFPFSDLPVNQNDPGTGIFGHDSGDEDLDVTKNIPPDVYGPPSYWEVEDDEKDPYGYEDPYEFRPEDNEPRPVYGPPPA